MKKVILFLTLVSSIGVIASPTSKNEKEDNFYCSARCGYIYGYNTLGGYSRESMKPSSHKDLLGVTGSTLEDTYLKLKEMCVQKGREVQKGFLDKYKQYDIPSFKQDAREAEGMSLFTRYTVVPTFKGSNSNELRVEYPSSATEICGRNK